MIELLRVILAGNETDYGVNGAEWWLKYYKRLPDYYITRDEAKKLGWSNKKGNLHMTALEKCSLEEYIIMMMGNYHRLKIEFGMRQILIINLAIGTLSEFYFQTMD